jgi:hypothetical protein
MMPLISETLKYFLPQSRWKMRIKSSLLAALSELAAVGSVNAAMDSRLSSMTSTRIMESTFFVPVLFRAWFILVIPFDTDFPPVCARGRATAAGEHTDLYITIQFSAFQYLNCFFAQIFV